MNYNIIGREKLAKIRQTTTVSDYNKEFLDVLLTCNDVADPEALDRYIRGLKFNVRKEIQLREINCLDTAMKFAEKVSLIETNDLVKNNGFDSRKYKESKNFKKNNNYKGRNFDPNYNKNNNYSNSVNNRNFKNTNSGFNKNHNNFNSSYKNNSNNSQLQWK